MTYDARGFSKQADRGQLVQCQDVGHVGFDSILVAQPLPG